MIRKEDQKEVIRAFEIFKKRSDDTKLSGLFEYIKDAQISQSNLENIYLDVIIIFNKLKLCKKYS
jgi:hypothetical protein